jgi:hypothetical protein
MAWHILDIFFVLFHTTLVLFNLFGWIWKKTRLLNLFLLALTGASWLFLGLIVGTLGYCPLTDWHFRVLSRMGETNIPDSYIKYLADRITGMDFNRILVDKVTLYSYLAALVLSFYFNMHDYLVKKRLKNNSA